MSQANPTITAVIQLATLIVILAAVVILSITHAVHTQAIAALLGGIVAHGGIVAYNGATKGAPTAADQGLARAVETAAVEAINTTTHRTPGPGA